MQAEFDITVFGASGFTGRLAAEYLMQNSQGLKIAIAGRNAAKLAEVAAQCATPPTVLLADSQQQSSIVEMVKRSRVIANFAGPFSLYAEPVIAACAGHGRHYCDITGETPFIKKMIRAYHSSATITGACLIPFAGFDSVPAELTTYLALEHARTHGYRLTEMIHYYQMRAGLNGGTLASAITMAEAKAGRDLYDPNALILDPKWPRQPRVQLGPRYEPLLERWSSPFIMGPVNTAVVRRSAYLRGEKEPFVYEERMLFGKDLRGQLEAGLGTLALGAFGLVTGSPLGRKLAQRFGPQPGQGPDEERRKRNFFRGRLIGRAEDQPKVMVTMEAQGDPGNETTITFASEVAKLLAEGQHGNVKGFSSPSVAFPDALIERLREKDMKFLVESLA